MGPRFRALPASPTARWPGHSGPRKLTPSPASRACHPLPIRVQRRTLPANEHAPPVTRELSASPWRGATPSRAFLAPSSEFTICRVEPQAFSREDQMHFYKCPPEGEIIWVFSVMSRNNEMKFPTKDIHSVYSHVG